MYRLFLGVVLLIGVASGLVKERTFASLASTATSASDTFTGGSVVLSVGETTGTLAATNLGLGRSFATIVTVQNTGTSSLRYSMRVSVASGSSTALANTLQLTVKDGPLSSGVCTGTNLYTDGTNLNGGGFGSSATGQQTGDKTLAPGSETLCFTISLPSAAPSTLTDYTTTLVYTFTAEQVAGT